ncbi:hypothetical protein HKD37_11G032347 [Glycine soja]
MTILLNKFTLGGNPSIENCPKKASNDPRNEKENERRYVELLTSPCLSSALKALTRIVIAGPHSWSSSSLVLRPSSLSLVLTRAPSFASRHETKFVIMSGSGSNSRGGDTTAGGSSLVARSKYKNTPGNRTDIGSKHGIDVNGNGKKVKCKYCSKIVSGGVFRFKRHLARTREDSEPCATVPDEIKLLMMKIIAESKATKEKKRRLNSIDEDEESVEGAEATNLQG